MSELSSCLLIISPNATQLLPTQVLEFALAFLQECGHSSFSDICTAGGPRLRGVQQAQNTGDSGPRTGENKKEKERGGTSTLTGSSSAATSCAAMHVVDGTSSYQTRTPLCQCGTVAALLLLSKAGVH